MTDLYLDFETFSNCDLKATGVHVYAAHPSTRALMLAWAYDNGEVQQWVKGEPLPKQLLLDLQDRSITKRAFNAQFERLIFKHTLGIDVAPEQWRCSMVLAMSLALPGGLDKLGGVVRIAEDKQKMAAGKKLIGIFCKTRKPTKVKPNVVCNKYTNYEDWIEFLRYNRLDIEAERAIVKKIRKWDLSDEEQARWCLDQKINDRGIPVNREAVSNALELVEDMGLDYMSSLRNLTELSNPNSTAQMLPWLQKQGYKYYDLRAGHVREAAKTAQGDLAEALNGRLVLSQSSVKKYKAVCDALSEDNTLKGCFQFMGASRTGRWSGRRFQPQNLKKAAGEYEKRQEEMAKDLEHLNYAEVKTKYGNPTNLLASAVRSVVQARPGYLLGDADLGAIENRVLGWVCGEDKILSVFRDGRCPYVDFATFLFKQSYEGLYAEYKAGDKSKRTLAKPAVLGAGYGLSAGYEYEDKSTGEMIATGLMGYSRGMGIDMTAAQCEHSIAVFREAYPRVPAYWKEIEGAAMKCAAYGKPTKAGLIRFTMDNPFLIMHLPSGRNLYYLRPKIESRLMVWGDYKDSLTYEGPDDRGHISRIPTYYGKLVENAVQALARDILAEGMIKADKRGLDICMHVHDEIVIESREDRAEEELKILIECMEESPAWCSDLPLKAEGSLSWFFAKD